MALVDVLDEAGAGGLPAQELLRDAAGGGHVPDKAAGRDGVGLDELDAALDRIDAQTLA